MGLDITAYRSVEYVEEAELDRDGFPIDESLNAAPFINQAFPGRADDVEDFPFRYAESDQFRAGSYGGYKRWRDLLAQVAGLASARDTWHGDNQTTPFAEMLNFSDCEGVIGAAVSEKLYQDFKAHKERGRELMDEWDFGLYESWERAFDLARHDGLVEFH